MFQNVSSRKNLVSELAAVLVALTVTHFPPILLTVRRQIINAPAKTWSYVLRDPQDKFVRMSCCDFNSLS